MTKRAQVDGTEDDGADDANGKARPDSNGKAHADRVGGFVSYDHVSYAGAPAYETHAQMPCPSVCR
eukprot:7147227-Pyramimonas_sp.AAC.1